MQELLIKEGILYVAIVLISFGATALSTKFLEGIISLILGAGIIVIRGWLKSKNIQS